VCVRSVRATLLLLDECYGAVILSIAQSAVHHLPPRPPTPNRDVLCFNARVYAVRLLAQRMLLLDEAIDEMHVREEPFDLRSVVFVG